MKQRAQGRASLIEFLRSIKFSSHRSSASQRESCSTHFAGFEQSARTRRQYSTEDAIVTRSAN